MADETEEENTEEKKSKGGLLQIILIVLVVTALGGAGFAVMKMMEMQDTLVAMQQAADDSAEKNLSDIPGMLVEGPGQQITIDPLTVNLSDGDGSRYLRISMKFEIPENADDDTLEPYMGGIKDLLINVLSSKTSEMLRTPQGKYALKEELKYRINEIIGGEPPMVRKIYFGEFIIQ